VQNSEKEKEGYEYDGMVWQVCCVRAQRKVLNLECKSEVVMDD